ncbi:MAG: ATP-binding protein [Methanospirillum sp.]
MKLVVASGKGGTGKTTVAANLAFTLARSREVVAVDCDVEGPNLHLYFPSDFQEVPALVPVPAFDADRCTLCGECGRVCRFGAISVLPTGVFFLPDLCHSCGGCGFVCPENAVRNEYRAVGTVRSARPFPSLTLIGGALGEGEVQGPAVVRQAKALAGDAPLVVLDAPPGIGCTVIEALKGADACLLVTESTPFGAHDLALAAEVVGQLGFPAGVVINRSDGDDRVTRQLCRDLGLPVLMTIPFDRSIAAIQNGGGLIAREREGWRSRFVTLFDDACALRGGA